MQRDAIPSLAQWSLDLNLSKCKGLPSWSKRISFLKSILYQNYFQRVLLCIVYWSQLIYVIFRTWCPVHYSTVSLCFGTMDVQKYPWCNTFSERKFSNCSEQPWKIKLFFPIFSFQYIRSLFHLHFYDKLICKRTVPNIPCLANNEILEVKRNILLCKDKSCVGCFQGEHFPVCA